MTRSNETIPRHYGDIGQSAPLMYADLLAMQQTGGSEFPGLITTLRTELSSGIEDEVLTLGVMATARVLADNQLTSADRTGKVAALLDSTIYDSLVGLETSYDMKGAISYGAAYYEEKEHGDLVHANPEDLNDWEDIVRDAAEKHGVTFRHPADARLFGYIQMAGHEAGHALLGGISVAIREKNGEPFSQGVAESRYLAVHPDQGFTGHWETDLAVTGERFAETYANIATRKAMLAAGYNDAEASKLMQAFVRPADVEGERGNNQIDHLPVVDRQRGPADFVTNRTSPQALNPGYLGYGLAFTEKQMVGMLCELYDKAFDVEKQHVSYNVADTTRREPDPIDWEHAVITFQNPVIATYLKSLAKQRRAELQANGQGIPAMSVIATAVKRLVAGRRT